MLVARCVQYCTSGLAAEARGVEVVEFCAWPYRLPVSIARTVLAYHSLPPCAVGTPSVFSVAAMVRYDEPDERMARQSVGMCVTIMAVIV